MLTLSAVGGKLLLPKNRLLNVILITNHRKNSSQTLYPTIRPDSIEHCSKMLEKPSFITEHRALIIQKSLQNLKNGQIKLKSNIRSIFINDPMRGKGKNGASLFLYEIIPLVKYHNPNVNVVCTKDETLPWNLEIGFEKDTITIPVETSSYKSILEEFFSLAKEKNL